MIGRLAAILGTFALAGCGAGQTLTSIQGGESKVFERPPYAVLGKTRYDQRWINSQVEGGVAAFGWERPAPRPPELDVAPAPKKAIVAKKKKSLLRRVKDRIIPPAAASVWPDPSTFRQVEIAPAPASQTPATAAPLPPPPSRDAVDELLDPTTVPNIRRVR